MARISRAEKDKKIIDENPNASIHDLRLLGVSEQKLAEMEAVQTGTIKPQHVYEPSQKVAPIVIPDLQPTMRAKPIIKTPVFIKTDDLVVVKDTQTGKRTRMRRIYAEKMANKKLNKNRYVIEG